MTERTLSMIKPDAVSRNRIGAILKRYEEASLKIVALKMTQLTPHEAMAFYHVHQGKPFFSTLIPFICSGPIVAVVLEGEGAILKTRALMGATNPKEAPNGTLRRDFGSSIEENAVHGSDSAETAAFEIPFFFHDLS